MVVSAARDMQVVFDGQQKLSGRSPWLHREEFAGQVDDCRPNKSLVGIAHVVETRAASDTTRSGIRGLDMFPSPDFCSPSRGVLIVLLNSYVRFGRLTC